MRILIFLSHPAQYLFYRQTIKNLKKLDHEVFILAKTKDILTDLLDEEGVEYINILPTARSNSKISIAWSLIKRNYKIFQFAKRKGISLLLGSDASPAHVGLLLGIPSITTLEDDYKIIRRLAQLTYPITSCILTPEICDVGKWSHKKVGYNSYMKLAYLNPNNFKPQLQEIKVAQNPFYLIRLSGLNAHHDFGKKGVSDELLQKIIHLLSRKGHVYITSERILPQKFEKHRLKIPPSELHNYLFYADMLISDSQSMSVEAAILGTPSVRISTFAGEISVLEELENYYELTFGLKPHQETRILQKITELLNDNELNKKFQDRRRKLLDEKINTADFLTWFISSYPESRERMKKDPDYQYTFSNY